MRISSRITLALLLTWTLVGCTSGPEQRFRTQAQQLRLRTMPSGSTASDPAVSRSGTVLSAAWDVRSDLKRDALEARLSEVLKPDFTKTISEGDRLCFAKYDDGESNRLEVSIAPETDGRTIAHIRLTIAPD